MLCNRYKLQGLDLLYDRSSTTVSNLFFAVHRGLFIILLGEDLLEGFSRWKDKERMFASHALIGSRNSLKRDLFLGEECKRFR